MAYNLSRFGRAGAQFAVSVGAGLAGVGTAATGAATFVALPSVAATQAGLQIYGGAAQQVGDMIGVDTDLADRVVDATEFSSDGGLTTNVARFGMGASLEGAELFFFKAPALSAQGAELLQSGGQGNLPLEDTALGELYRFSLIGQDDTLDKDNISSPGAKSQWLYDVDLHSMTGVKEPNRAGVAVGNLVFNPTSKASMPIKIADAVVSAADLLEEADIDWTRITSEEEFDEKLKAAIEIAKDVAMGTPQVEEAQASLNQAPSADRASMRARILAGPDGWASVGQPERSMVAMARFREKMYDAVDAEWNAWRSAGGTSRLDREVIG